MIRPALTFCRGMATTSKAVQDVAAVLSSPSSWGTSIRDFPLSEFGKVTGGKDASDNVKATFISWHLAVHEQKPDSLEKYLGNRVKDDVKFHPPTYFKPWEGKVEFFCLIQSAGETFGPGFTYHRQWLSDDGREWALEFESDVGNSGKRVQGIDMVSLDENGMIVDFKVLARPPNAVSALKDEMMKRVPSRMAVAKMKQAAGNLFGGFGGGKKS